MQKSGRPGADEHAPYYLGYIGRITSDDIVGTMEEQRDQALAFWGGIAEEKSRHRYEPGKWSIREVLAHVNDTERVFLFRAFWFARGFDLPLPSFDQDVAAGTAHADERSLASLLEEFRSIRESGLTLVRTIAPEDWMRRGMASGNPFTVRAAVYTLAGHAAHHQAVVRERYL